MTDNHREELIELRLAYADLHAVPWWDRWLKRYYIYHLARRLFDVNRVVRPLVDQGVLETQFDLHKIDKLLKKYRSFYQSAT